MDKLLHVSHRIWRTALLLLAGVSCFVSTAQAQADTYQFSATQGAFTPLPAAATSASAVEDDDAISGAIPIGFSFAFDGVPYTNVYASSNGFLSFNSAATSSLTNDLDAASASLRPLLAPLWDDLAGEGTGSAAKYQTTGTAPNRVFTFEWLNWEWNYSASAPVISFQVKLYETSNRVEFVYRPENGTPNSASASIGIVGAGSPVSFLSLNNTSASPTASSTTETTSLNTKPASGQVYAFQATNCTRISNLTVGSITSNSASVTFTGVTGVNSYTAVATPATGPAVTVTGTGSPLQLTGLQGLMQYQVTVVSNCGAGQSSAPVVATFNTLLPPSVNDEPCNATPLTIGTGNTYQTTNSTNLGATATVANGYSNPGCTTAANPKDVWFSIALPGGGGTTALSIIATGNPAGQVRLFSAPNCNGPFTQIACKGAAGPNTAAGTLVATGLASGAIYYVSVSGFGSSDAQGPFTLQVGQGVLAVKGELPGGEVSVFPNPSTNGQLMVRIAGAATSTAQATLLNNLGQTVLTQQVSLRAGTAEQPLSVKNLAKGIYTLRVQVGDILIARKVVLE
ncbi:T9SS type A sorting domain-containing protein [Hymenobacter psychrotolerans]|uniref:Por secretion system C-terminal sorting domain-containing protein n=1 Tax=Hymenobacter psychrotolerans DSM 18569 TaxID=1121959 RepID=A0A1M7GQ21_9BACT|nr:T9SS type A sorting domain-containing protein [Hymenobacter psychrotolerans]SHM18281.1 Por secretion system C-terminal sorting domain-containing protein [Hymenobacter psychrotolerans DSM 18569]